MERIESMPQDKRERIVNAAMAEFAVGYHQASTDVIVREAGISKGLLYHYFGTKKALFLWLLRYGVMMMIDEYLSLINLSQRDILERWRQTTLLKLDLLKRHPDIFAFVTRGFLEADEEVAAAVEQMKRELLTDVSPQVFDDVDTSCFRDDIPPEVIKRMITTLMIDLAEGEALGKSKLSDFDGDYDAMLQKVDDYIVYMRKCFYKN